VVTVGGQSNFRSEGGMPRPKEHRISRFNVATDLVENLKFARFCQALGVCESRGFTLVVRLFNFVAANRAMTGSIAGIEPWIIARFCWWDSKDDGAPELLIAALKKAGYLEQDGTVHDWFEHQPLAADVMRKRLKEKGDSSEPSTKGTDISDTNSDISRSSQSNSKRTKHNSTLDQSSQVCARAREGEEEIIALTEVTESICESLVLTKKAQRKACADWVKRVAEKTNDQAIFRLKGELEEGLKSGKIANPIGFFISICQKICGDEPVGKK
jgi:hypothetical protein